MSAAKGSTAKKRKSYAATSVRREEGLEKLAADLAKNGVERVKIGGVDVDGVLRGKYVSLKKFRSALQNGFGFCDVVFGWDIGDILYDNSRVTGWHSGYPDAHAVLDPDSLRMIPWEPGVAAMLCDFQDTEGNPHPACPRSLLKSVLSRLDALGYQAMFGTEFEFFFFQETRDTLQEKGFRGLKPLDPGMMGYSWVRTGQDAALVDDIWKSCAGFGVHLEGLHTETGPGVYEAAIGYTDALSQADQAVLFKTTVKQVAHRHGLAVTFMAKCNQDMPGSSGHLHQSLWKNSKNAFADAQAEYGMSELMRQYVAGQLSILSEWTALFNPTVNSYKRFVPGLWAPVVGSWGVENRTCSIRVVSPGDNTAIRGEFRQTAADMNPYIAMAACLAAGLMGIEAQMVLPAPTTGDPGQGGEAALPTSLRQATDVLARSESARSALGVAFVDHYVRTRDWEARQYERAVTDWELRRYFESV
jgi:glutamine synthetase